MKRSHSNALLNGLTPGQERAIRALLNARSVAAAARQANVGQSTLRRWLREDDNFETELHRYREEALCFASLILQRNLAWVVGLMYEFTKTDAPVPQGKVTLIRTAIEYAFRSAVYCDIVGRVRALERIQRQNQSDGNNPPAAAAPPVSGSHATPDRHLPTASKQNTSQDSWPQRANFRRSAHSCSNPAAKDEQILRQSAQLLNPDPETQVGGLLRRAASRLRRVVRASRSLPNTSISPNGQGICPLSPVQPPRDPANQPSKDRKKLALASRIAHKEISVDPTEAWTAAHAQFLHSNPSGRPPRAPFRGLGFS